MRVMSQGCIAYDDMDCPKCKAPAACGIVRDPTTVSFYFRCKCCGYDMKHNVTDYKKGTDAQAPTT